MPFLVFHCVKEFYCIKNWVSKKKKKYCVNLSFAIDPALTVMAASNKSQKNGIKSNTLYCGSVSILCVSQPMAGSLIQDILRAEAQVT